MVQWMRRHKIVTLLVFVLLLGSCSAVFSGDKDSDDADDAPAAERPLADTSESTASETPSPSPTAEPEVREPTQQEVWAANYEVSRASYVATVATALALRPRKVDAPLGALNACRSLDKGRTLERRVAEARTSFPLAGAPTYDQALAALDATVAVICPEYATVHETQVAAHAKRVRIEERRRKERERLREQREAEALEAQQQQEREEQEEQEQQQNVYYENCTAVENAGAAPIYAGDPGYSRDLDRDGDGVACEQ